MRRLGAGCRLCPRPRGETLRCICMALAWCTHGVCTCSKMSVMAVALTLTLTLTLSRLSLTCSKMSVMAVALTLTLP